jgi:hypothetical protein
MEREIEYVDEEGKRQRKKTLYSPGNNHTDPFYGACIMSNSGCNSYYKVESYSTAGNSFPFGIFINNADENHCVDALWCRGGALLAHNWANRITGVHLEIYSHHEEYGGASIWASDFVHEANGGVYSQDLGTVTLPNGSNLEPDPVTGEYAVARLSGYIFTDTGDSPAPGRVTMHLWGSTSQATTTTGVGVLGYSSTDSIDGGYYKSGWLYPGIYHCMLIDNGSQPTKSKEFDVELRRPFERLDFTLESDDTSTTIVPDVVGDFKFDATDTLRAAHLVPRFVGSFAQSPPNVVRSQSPPAKTPVKRGAVITCTMGKP